MEKLNDSGRPLALIILDGWGESPTSPVNAITVAKTPNMDGYKKHYPWTTLGSSGESVGLPVGQMGNSEVGHLNMGAGRIIYQDFLRINNAVSSGEFFENPVLSKAVYRVHGGRNRLHLMGLVSDGGVHSHQNHLYALVEMAKRSGLSPDQVVIHAYLDGRDTPPRSAEGYLRQLEERISALGIGRIGTISGRYYAMDRDNRWDRVKLAYDALTRWDGYGADDSESAIRDAYARGENDEFVKPTVIGDPAPISDGDSVIFFNFRPDRGREMSRAFTDPDFAGFDRKKFSLFFASFTRYDDTFSFPVAFDKYVPCNTFGEVVSNAGLRQLRIAETEKYAHVTFFFSGGMEEPFPGEERFLVPSPKVATYDLKPEMSAYEVAQECVGKIESGRYDVIILNFANADMVGHTGIMDAAVAACEAVDECVGMVVDAVLASGGSAIITADHGNSDMMTEVDGTPFTAHTLSPVPCILICGGFYDKEVELRSDGVLADIAPTLLDSMGIEKPAEMSGKSILKKQS
ncbi:MAG: 2,3-bisphosphoglycerate-independent phosphoglycerate mutase [Thermoplasmata archaeon HGW-Thermoplasmata-1]|nr:MAG: 2,3-bisphosphoglycerate-independent phosphoglycerate mutase [Thermoplasmata archaeon HGW-Thermoplasmata-1]